MSGRPHAANFISSSTVWGLLRGMESLSQLVVMEADENGALAVSTDSKHIFESG